MQRWQRVGLWVFGIAVSLILIGAAGFVIWGMTPQGPAAVAKTAAVSDTLVNVTEKGGVHYFAPASGEATAGVIIYPGGHVDALSYAPLARALAEQGVLAAVPEMPLSLAFLRADAADDIIALNPSVKTWILAGHSLGGIAAAQYAAGHTDKVDGLVFLASYPAEGTDLTDIGVPVTLVHGSNDGLVSQDDLKAAIPRLPADVSLAELSGGNHAQFGDYGVQKGDGTATISAEEQTCATVDAIMLTLRDAKTR